MLVSHGLINHQDQHKRSVWRRIQTRWGIFHNLATKRGGKCLSCNVKCTYEIPYQCSDRISRLHDVCYRHSSVVMRPNNDALLQNSRVNNEIWTETTQMPHMFTECVKVISTINQILCFLTFLAAVRLVFRGSLSPLTSSAVLSIKRHKKDKEKKRFLAAKVYYIRISVQ